MSHSAVGGRAGRPPPEGQSPLRVPQGQDCDSEGSGLSGGLQGDTGGEVEFHPVIQIR